MFNFFQNHLSHYHVISTCLNHIVFYNKTQTVKHLPTMQETWVQTLGSGRSSGEGNGNPLQYSCLENPMDEGAWKAAVYGVTKSLTLTE